MSQDEQDAFDCLFWDEDQGGRDRNWSWTRKAARVAVKGLGAMGAVWSVVETKVARARPRVGRRIKRQKKQ